ncbi:dihydrofolate reductase [Neobacillus sp. YIM B02564]|uniref:Dihydrofolate reductase n=1 Tax=Neobacillus paridis TaxID=2803862 RepID=A0ABS1TIF9_9BACI|nr:dihydrofolate reductase [Neobacillus paridis]MBL4951115.1 dihydrofolate reductase [Neobacillus paridis]
MSINLITAIGLNREIGFQGNLLCHLPNDLKHFKKLTSGHFVVMGANTFNSIGHSLPDRQNIILSHKTKHNFPPDVYVYNSIEDILFEYENYANKDVELFIIGGESLYRQFLPYCDRIYLTIIDNIFNEADTFFPEIDISEWKIIEHIVNNKDESHKYNYHYITYERF